MDVVITTFTNPFSFFCVAQNECRVECKLGAEFDLDEKVNINHSSKSEMSDCNHGQYVAVLWKNKWVRGIITMETQFLIWLIDYGIYLRPTDNTVYIDLPAEYKKQPTKVFEASIHGVTPVDKGLSILCQIENVISKTWNQGAVAMAENLIKNAIKLHFVPIALMTTKNNEIVIGDLYLTTEDGIVNIVDKLEEWPVFLQKDKETYVKSLPINYISRRRHRNCLLKPEFPNMDLPIMTLNTSLAEYDTIISNGLQFSPEVDSEDGSTVVADNGKEDKPYKLTPAEIERYAHMYVTVSGREYNVLNVLLNKIRDLNMCERYKDHDLKSVGRANSRRRYCTE